MDHKGALEASNNSSAEYLFHRVSRLFSLYLSDSADASSVSFYIASFQHSEAEYDLGDKSLQWYCSIAY